MSKLTKTKQTDLNMSLIRACLNNDLKQVKETIKNGADVHADNDTPLHLASMRGYLDVVKVLIENGADYVVGIAGACNDKKLEVIKYLVEQSSNIHKSLIYSLAYSNGDFRDEVLAYKTSMKKY
jgi:ankyrin repeat protein